MTKWSNKSGAWCGFKMLVGEEEDKKKYNYERDRYGAQEKKRAALEVEQNMRKIEEQSMKKIDRTKMLYNNWFDLTKTKFWIKNVRKDVTYYGIHTKFK
tara:strand:+ start:2151 stop:2447 length:297 start_codon:yes stop_codon:yes gene_type:complete